MINIRIVVERQPTELTCERWTFDLFDRYNNFTLHLVEYRNLKRTTRRHKFRVVPGGYYNPYEKRLSPLKVEDVPLPDDVIAEAKEKFMDEMKQVRVIKEW